MSADQLDSLGGPIARSSKSCSRVRGTLVHEIVHPFIEANFPDCPSWFNEGLASMYEQCRDNSGHIWGSTNWRLNGLKEAIAEQRVPAFSGVHSM